jgi:hypothetical protein
VNGECVMMRGGVGEERYDGLCILARFTLRDGMLGHQGPECLFESQLRLSLLCVVFGLLFPLLLFLLFLLFFFLLG